MPIQYETVMTFESKSSTTGKCYTVKRRLDTGALGCDCPQWIFDRNGNRTCYHTMAVLASKVLDERDELLRERSTRKVNVPNEDRITERPRQLMLEKKEE